MSSIRDSFLQKVRFWLKPDRRAAVSYENCMMGLMCEKAQTGREDGLFAELSESSRPRL